MIEYLRKTTYHFSMRKLAEQAGFSTPNIFQQVIIGKRKLNDKSIRQIASLFSLSDNEFDFFTNLVKMNQATIHEEKDLYYQKLSSFRSYTLLNKEDRQLYSFYSRWYYPVIRELVTTVDFTADPAWIASRISPSITVAEAQQALRVLEKCGQIRKTEQGYVQNTPVVTTGEEVASVAVTNYHKAMMRKAQESLDRFPHTQRNISSLTFAASETMFEKIVKEIYTLQQRVIDMLGEDTSSHEVYQMNFQLFPCTHAKGKKN
jgi:uncharacterized protein (TIGR02147 family)